MQVLRAGTPGTTPLLLLHGGGVAGWMWEPLRRYLPPEVDLFVPDLPGHGRSAGTPYASHEQTAQGLLEVVASHASGPVAVAGFSFGAQVAVLLAASAPALVSRVTVISAQAEPARFPALTLGLLAAAAPLARSPRFARLQARELFVPDELMDEYVRTSASLTSRTLVDVVGDNIRFTIPPAWSDYPGRALILTGEKERAVMKRSARRLHEALPGSALEIVPDCGHGIPLQRPEWLARRLLDD